MPETNNVVFAFNTRLSLSELTGLKAWNLEQLLEQLKTVPGACIFHHTHRILQQHLRLSPEPPNDFAYWAANSLGDDQLGEALASINIADFSSLHALRGQIIATVEQHLARHPQAKQRFASDDEPFHFIKSISFVLPANRSAGTLAELAACIRTVPTDSIYFHMFEARLRLERGDNDFSRWIRDSLGNKKLSDKISRLDPYTCTSECLREKLASLIERQEAA